LLLFCRQMKSVIIFFLFLCFLLLTGHNHLYSSNYQSRSSYSVPKLAELSKQSALETNTKSQYIIRNDAPSDNEEDALSATETEDDDELLAPRKYVEITNYLITFFYSHAAGLANSRMQTRLPFCKHFSYTSSDIYIVQRVIKV
jgi:hypothetical protein